MEESFQTPLILTALCFASGLVLFLATLFWMWRLYKGDNTLRSLRAQVTVWWLRAFTCIVVLSFIATLATGPHPLIVYIPEISLLFLLAAAYLLPGRHINLVQEIYKIPAVALLCIVAAYLSGTAIMLLQQVIPDPALPVLLVGLVWNMPLVWFYRALQRKRLPSLPEDFKFHYALWPILLAYLFFMIPMIVEHLGNSPKIDAFLHSSPPLQRV